MFNFIKNILIFLSPFLLLIPVEMSLRDNTFKATRDHIENNKDDVEVLFMGSSHFWRGINPSHLDKPSAVVAHGGIKLDMCLRIFDKYFDDLPKIEIVFFDITVGSFESKTSQESEKNHLYYLYYGLNNYGKRPPIKDNFLLTSSPKNYLKKYMKIKFHSFKEKKNSDFNKYGFVTSIPINFDEFRQANYDSTAIANSFDYSLLQKHSYTNDTNYSDLTLELDKAIQRCLDRGIKVILMSTPKYYLYTHNTAEVLLERRSKFLSKYQGHPAVEIWNYEGQLEYEERYYIDVNHLNTNGAEVFTKRINNRLDSLLL